MTQTDCQVATSCAHIQDSKTSVRMRCTPFLCQAHALLNQHFTFWAWDEDVRIQGEFQRPEFLFCRDVLHRLTTQPALQALAVSYLLVWTEGTGGIQVESRSCHAQQVAQEHFCGSSRLRHTASLQTAYRLPESGPDGLVHPSTAWSLAVRSARDNASTTSSNRPSMISSSLYKVSWIRWSVRRLWGKLYVRIRSLRSPLPIWERRCSERWA